MGIDLLHLSKTCFLLIALSVSRIIKTFIWRSRESAIWV